MFPISNSAYRPITNPSKFPRKSCAFKLRHKFPLQIKLLHGLTFPVFFSNFSISICVFPTFCIFPPMF